MPPDVAVKSIDFEKLREKYFCVDVQQSTFNGEKNNGRKLWLSFLFENLPCSKIFHLTNPVIVMIDNHHYFQETLSKENKEIGYAFKKFTESNYQFLRNTDLITAAHSYHVSPDDHPNFLGLKKDHKKLWIN